jgi:hypothetical protein
MKTLNVKWTGIRPLIMHSAAMIDPDNAAVRAKNKLQRDLKQLKKDDEDGRERKRREIERMEWEGSLYWNGSALYVPGDNIMACIVAGARKIKMGKQVEQSLVPPDDAPLEIAALRAGMSLDQIFETDGFQLRAPVRIPPKTGSRVMSVRPMIPTGWAIEFGLEFDETICPVKDLREAMNNAGALIGLGDWRPKFGRFTVDAK